MSKYHRTEYCSKIHDGRQCRRLADREARFKGFVIRVCFPCWQGAGEPMFRWKGGRQWWKANDL